MLQEKASSDKGRKEEMIFFMEDQVIALKYRIYYIIANIKVFFQTIACGHSEDR